MGRTAFWLCLILILMLMACAPTPQPQASPQPPPQQTRNLKLQVYDDTQKRPVNNLEIWVRGFGSWWPDLKHGADLKVTGPWPVSKPNELYIYPDGRDKTEILVWVAATPNVISGSDRDAIIIEIHDSEVVVTSGLIEGVTQKFGR